MRTSTLLKWSIALCLAVLTTAAFADANLHIAEYYCSSDGTFRVGVKALGMGSFGYDSHLCAYLTSTTASAPRDVVRQDRFATPPGNALNLALESLFGPNIAKAENFPFAEAREYIVKTGVCESHRIFVVIEAWHEHFPSFGGNDDDFKCLYERFSAISVRSRVDITGVYEADPEADATEFAQTLPR